MSVYILLLLLLINLKNYTSTLLSGKRAHEGQFPWLIQFETVVPCGGVLVSNDWVLTAAQCVQDRRSSILLLATGLNGTGSIQTIPVKATYIHPRYEAHSVHPDRDHNIALLKLVKPFATHNANVHLPTVLSGRYDDNYRSCLIFGWQSYLSPSSNVLAKPIRYSQAIVNSWKLCAYMIKTNENYTNVFCAMVELKDELKACAGNPGTPVICENQYRRAVLLGIASWTNFTLECGILPTYVDLDDFRIWMHDIMFNNNTKTRQENDNESNERNVQFKETYDTRESPRDNGDAVQADNRFRLADTHARSENISTVATKESRHVSTSNTTTTSFLNKLYLPIYKNVSDTNASSLDSFKNVMYSNIMKEPSNTIYEYKQIGKVKSFLCQNETVRTLDERKKFEDANKSLLRDNGKLGTIEAERSVDETELDDIYAILSSISCSSINIIYYKNLYILCFTVLYYVLDIIFYI